LPWSGSTANKTILHIDCDAFFASVEQSLNPELKGKPIVTGKERGIAASFSYEAKRRGVVRGMNLLEVKKVCPDAVILPNDYETYSLVSQNLFTILRRFTPEVEEYSIDEAFADISGLRRLYRSSYERIALDIKETVERELGITVSVGLSLSKSLAKICSRHRKPSGFTAVGELDLMSFLKGVPIRQVCGFGPNSEAFLAKQGIHTVFEYVSKPLAFAEKLLGKIGGELWRELRGEVVYKVQRGTFIKPQASLSKVKTFTPPSSDKEFIKAQLLRNLESAFIKLRRHQLQTRTLGIYLRDHEFRSASLEARLTRPTASTLEAAPIAGELFERLFKPGRKYRQTGIYAWGLETLTEAQGDLFDDPCRIDTLKRISDVTDRINGLYGKHAIHLGSTHALSSYSQHLGSRGDLAPRKTLLFKGETFRQRLGLPVWKISV